MHCVIARATRKPAREIRLKEFYAAEEKKGLEAEAECKKATAPDLHQQSHVQWSKRFLEVQ